MIFKKPLLYGAFYVVAISAVVFAKSHPDMGLWWLSPLMYAAMSWPFFVKYHCGRFQFAFHCEEEFEPRDEKAFPEVEVDRRPRRKGPSSLDLLREANLAGKPKKCSDIDLSDIPLPPGKWKTNYPPKKDLTVKPAANRTRVTESKHDVPPAPAVTANSDTSDSDHEHDYWQSKHQRRSRHPDEYSLPLFPAEEAALNANVAQQDAFL
ncbi:hypothetical protein [Cupriavidus sp. TMH.W2]|uniref:hypothetical protein n=1 Tax=Cupriavidus sp. TMH.W2 TaxID=3434465 RepID=UPI003D77DEEE